MLGVLAFPHTVVLYALMVGDEISFLLALAVDAIGLLLARNMPELGTLILLISHKLFSEKSIVESVVVLLAIMREKKSFLILRYCAAR